MTSCSPPSEIRSAIPVICTLSTCLFLISCGVRMEEDPSSQVQPARYEQRVSENNGLAMPEYIRRVSPFPTVDQSGQVYEHPFLGGFNMPRPQLLDLSLIHI